MIDHSNFDDSFVDWADGIRTMEHHFSGTMWEGWVSTFGPQITELGAQLQNRRIPAPSSIQIKEKLGEMRIYAFLGQDVGEEERAWFFSYIGRMSQQSGKTCRRCAQPCRIRSVGGWCTPICTNCMQFEKRTGRSGRIQIAEPVFSDRGRDERTIL